jgi:heme/copper-type cytochrome/quinol oxidase subunit 3
MAAAAEISPAENARLAMKIFMASWTLSFFALIGAYLYLRANASVWPPDGAPRPPLGLTAVATAVALSASVVLQRGVNARRAGRPRELRTTLGFAAALGALFLALQTGTGVLAWRQGLVPGLNAYAGLFWLTAAFHAVHVAVGVVALLVLVARSGPTAEFGPDALLPELWVVYWHGVDFVWLCIFAAMFLPG